MHTSLRGVINLLPFGGSILVPPQPQPLTIPISGHVIEDCLKTNPTEADKIWKYFLKGMKKYYWRFLCDRNNVLQCCNNKYVALSIFCHLQHAGNRL